MQLKAPLNPLCTDDSFSGAGGLIKVGMAELNVRERSAVARHQCAVVEMNRTGSGTRGY